MSVKEASTTFGIASLQIQMGSLQPWLIIKLSPPFLGKTWLWQHQDNVLNMSINGASMTFGLASWKMQGLRGDIKLLSNYWSPLYGKMVATASLLCTNIERQWSVNNFWPCICAQARVIRRHWPIIELSAAFLDKNASNKIVTMSQHEHQLSVNKF
jgi:hypothetical protein